MAATDPSERAGSKRAYGFRENGWDASQMHRSLLQKGLGGAFRFSGTWMQEQTFLKLGFTFFQPMKPRAPVLCLQVPIQPQNFSKAPGAACLKSFTSWGPHTMPTLVKGVTTHLVILVTQFGALMTLNPKPYDPIYN